MNSTLISAQRTLNWPWIHGQCWSAGLHQSDAGSSEEPNGEALIVPQGWNLLYFQENNFWSKMPVFLRIVSLKFDQREECFYLALENVILASTQSEKFSTVLLVVVGSTRMNSISLWSTIPKIQPSGAMPSICQTCLRKTAYL